MFSSKHAIWKFANAGDELDDWLPYAEELVRKWAKQSSLEIKFKGVFELYLAVLLLKDDLLPASARMVLGELMLKTIIEAMDKKLTIESLGIHPPKSGRRKINPQTLGYIMHKVSRIIRSGKTATEAYKVVSEELCKTPDTIRRIYEREMKRKPGEINK
jgi:hypothetical protein